MNHHVYAIFSCETVICQDTLGTKTMDVEDNSVSTGNNTIMVPPPDRPVCRTQHDVHFGSSAPQGLLFNDEPQTRRLFAKTDSEQTQYCIVTQSGRCFSHQESIQCRLFLTHVEDAGAAFAVGSREKTPPLAQMENILSSNPRRRSSSLSLSWQDIIVQYILQARNRTYSATYCTKQPVSILWL